MNNTANKNTHMTYLILEIARQPNFKFWKMKIDFFMFKLAIEWT